MRLKSIQDILPWVEQPSRYLGSEINRIQKDPRGVKLKFLLAFPDLYEIGTSHFGIQILYHLINRDPDILAERVFAPATDVESKMREHGIPLSSLESGIPLQGFDIIGFSLLYEMNYTNVLGMLSLGGIPFLASQRSEKDPLIIAGGPCTSNPEPVADFFDAMVIGDGEAVVAQLTRAWIQWKEHVGAPKDALLAQWSRIEGVYIPAYYEPAYDHTGFQTIRRTKNAIDIAPETVRRAIIPELGMEAFPKKPIVPFGKPVHDRLRIEVARGCSRGCRFCQAGMIYRPVRERSVAQLLDLTEQSLAATGYEDLSLLSLSTGDYGCIVPLMQAIMARCEAARIAVSFPSLRAGTLSQELMTLVKKVRKTGFTMAVEAGSQRLRDVINKNISREDIFTMVENAFGLGWQVIKLYFMIGLPGETRQDLKELVDLVKDIHKIKGPKGRKGKINVSVNTFIPKSHTPFQWVGQISLDESKEKIEWLKNELRLPRVQFKWQKPENSFLEGLWARGDRRLSRLLLSAYEKGCRFDGWSDQFRYDKWMESIRETGITPEFYVNRTRDMEEPLPWDHIDCRVTKSFLKNEWKRALEGESTADCRSAPCTMCGACDHETIQPKLAEIGDFEIPRSEDDLKSAQAFYKTVSVSYSRLGQARFFGHLEMVNIVLRAIRRARIPMAYSQGFHPLPKISFDDPLPLGFESKEEVFRLQVPAAFRTEDIIHRLTDELPEGLRILGCRFEASRPKGRTQRKETYEVTLYDETFDAGRVENFQSKSEVMICRRNKKGIISEIDLKQAVLEMNIVAPETIKMVLSIASGMTVRPGIVVAEVFNLPVNIIKAARIIKTGTEYV
jgi:radical SAM family uncharacterized protein/radical SAM-linked protein